MSSINTNLSALTALQSLKATQTSLNRNQNQISTGLRVAEASHNASYWSIATSMKSDNGALGAVKDAIKQSVAMIDTYSSAMAKTLSYLDKMKAGMVMANQPGADRNKIQTEFNAAIAGMKSAAASAQFNGQNWLAGDATLVHLVTSYDGVNNKVGTLTLDTKSTALFTDASAGTGGILAEVAAIDITAIAPTNSGTHTPPQVEWTPTAAAKVSFGLSVSDFAAGAQIHWKSTTGALVNYTFTGSEDSTTVAGILQSQAGAGVTVTWDGSLLTLQGSTVTDNLTAAFTRAGGSSVAGSYTPPQGVWTPKDPGQVVFSPAQVEILEGNFIRWSVDGGSVQSYRMAEGETGASLANAIQSQLGSGVTASWDDTTGLTIKAGVITSDVTAIFESGEMEQTLKNIDQAIENVTKASAILGANKALLETQQEFIGVLSDSLTAGVSAFVDADMNEASTRNQALQTQQQLGVQALSIANQNSQMILKLFQ